MKFEKTPLIGPLIATPAVFSDERGSFCETFQKEHLLAAGIKLEFVQDNEAHSQAGVLRGLHFQRPPHDQGKLVRVVQGSVLDVVVDLRKSSNTYGKSYKIELSAANRKILWVPPGFAHGYLSLTDGSIFLYKVSAYYNKASECGICWNDKDLAIDWGLNGKDPIVSDKDKDLLAFADLGEIFS